MAWSVDRLGRSLPHLIGFLDEAHALGVDLYLHQQGIDTRTPASAAMFQMCGVFAQFERAMIKERINAGLARAREKGTSSGRAFGRPRTSPAVEASIVAALASGKGIRKVAAEVGVGVGTVQRIKAQAA
jgi:DNA invertase Pin-like site-specific DNA recombinase